MQVCRFITLLFCLLYIVLSALSSFAIIDGEERAGCFNLIVSLVSCDYQCSVTSSHGAVC